MASYWTGGMDLRRQEAELRRRPDIIIATPGRIIDHLRNTPSIDLQTIEILIIDEADRYRKTFSMRMVN